MKSRNALVVGPVLEGHDFHPGWNDIRGRTTPWNTFAIWQTKKLAVIGFPLIGDGTADNRRIGGVEVSEFLLSCGSFKKLLGIGGLCDHLSSKSPQRRKYCNSYTNNKFYMEH